MTVSSAAAKAVHVTRTGVEEYSFLFKVFSARHLQVIVVDPVTRYETTLNLEEDYLLDDDDLTPEGGLIRLTEAGQLKAGDGRHLAITRRMDFLQEVDYRPHDIFPAETHERILDILTMQDQELREMLGRAVIAPADQDHPLQYAELLSLGHEARAAADEAAHSAGEAHDSAEGAEQAAVTAVDSAAIAVTAAGEADLKAGQIINLSTRANTLPPGEPASVQYDAETGELSLGIPKGEKGEAGKDGSGVNILGLRDSSSELPAAGQIGDAWLVGEELYIWDAAGQAWTNAGPVRGPKGEKGDKGETGERGLDGVDAVVAEATTSVKGIVQLATVADETSDDKAVTPAWVTENVVGGGFNTRQVITASKTFTAPVTGWYKVTCIGGGGGGGKGGTSVSGLGGKQGGSTSFGEISAAGGGGGGGGSTGASAVPAGGGGGGGAGFTTLQFIHLTQGMGVAVKIGAGGLGGTATVTGNIAGNGIGISAGLGGIGYAAAGTGAAGASSGCTGCYSNGNGSGGSGGINASGYGNGGGGGGGNFYAQMANGGVAGPGASTGTNNGGAGGPGAVILEYFDSNA